MDTRPDISFGEFKEWISRFSSDTDLFFRVLVTAIAVLAAKVLFEWLTGRTLLRKAEADRKKAEADLLRAKALKTLPQSTSNRRQSAVFLKPTKCQPLVSRVIIMLVSTTLVALPIWCILDALNFLPLPWPFLTIPGIFTILLLLLAVNDCLDDH